VIPIVLPRAHAADENMRGTVSSTTPQTSSTIATHLRRDRMSCTGGLSASLRPFPRGHGG